MKKRTTLLISILIAIISFSFNTYACNNSSLATTNTNINVSKDGKGYLKSTITFDNHYYNINYNTISQIEDSFNKSNLSNVTELYIYTSTISNCNCTNVELLLKFNSVNNLNSKLKTVFECIDYDYNIHSTINNSTFKCKFSAIDSLNSAINSILFIDAKLDYETKYPLYTLQFNKTTIALTLEDIINNSANAGIEDINDYEIIITNLKTSNNADNTKKNTKTIKTTTPKSKKIKLTPVKSTYTSIVNTTTAPNITLANINDYTNNNIDDNTKLIIMLSVILVCITFVTVFYIISRKKYNLQKP